MRTIMLAALCAVACSAGANAAIKEEPVTYSDGQTTMKGFVVYDDASSAKRPEALRRISSIWNIRSRAWSQPSAIAPSRSEPARMRGMPSASNDTCTSAPSPGMAASPGGGKDSHSAAATPARTSKRSVHAAATARRIHRNAPG